LAPHKLELSSGKLTSSLVQYPAGYAELLYYAFKFLANSSPVPVGLEVAYFVETEILSGLKAYYILATFNVFFSAPFLENLTSNVPSQHPSPP